MNILFTGDLQAIVSVQRDLLQQGGQALHPTQEHHHSSRRTQHTGQEETALRTQPLQHALGEDEELAGVLGQAEEVVLPAGHSGDVVGADGSL